MTRMTAALQVFSVAVSLTLSLAPVAQADPIQATYTTTGTIGTTGITSTPDVSFQGVSDGTLTTGQPFSLGQFVVTPPPDGGTTTYETPFQITVSVTSASGDPMLPSETPITLDGVLATFFVGSQKSLGAYFSSVGDPTIGGPPLNWLTHWITEDGVMTYGLRPTQGLLSLAPIGQNGGVFDVQAQLDAYSAPELSTLVTFLPVVMVLIAKYRLGGSRRSIRDGAASGPGS